MDKKDALMNTNFGRRVAEEEGDALKSYFVQTEQWRRIIAGDVDVVYGPKGSGKSAIYSLLQTEYETLRTQRRIVVIAAENPRGTPAFRDLVDDPPASEDEFRDLWKLYFLSLLANYMRRNYEVTKTSDTDASKVIEQLVGAGLLAPSSMNLRAMLKAALDYVRQRGVALEGGAEMEPATGAPKFTAKVTLGQPTVAQQSMGFESADDLIHRLRISE
jgi:hypothetical protein